jgi:hypothetical protein
MIATQSIVYSASLTRHITAWRGRNKEREKAQFCDIYEKGRETVPTGRKKRYFPDGCKSKECFLFSLSCC